MKHLNKTDFEKIVMNLTGRELEMSYTLICGPQKKVLVFGSDDAHLFLDDTGIFELVISPWERSLTETFSGKTPECIED